MKKGDSIMNAKLIKDIGMRLLMATLTGASTTLGSRLVDEAYNQKNKKSNTETKKKKEGSE